MQDTFKISVSVTSKIPNLVFSWWVEITYWRWWRADFKLSIDFSRTVFSFSWFQLITDYMTNEFLYCSVLYGVASNVIELSLAELTTTLALSKSSKRLGFIIIIGLHCTNNSSGFIAGTRHSTTSSCWLVLLYCRFSSSKSASILVMNIAALRWIFSSWFILFVVPGIWIPYYRAIFHRRSY